MKKSAREQGSGSIHYPFWFGGSAAAMATCLTHPFELVKVRLQTRDLGAPQRRVGGTLVYIVKNEGVPGLYSGISASLLRQLTYSTIRFGMYEEMKRLVPSDAGFSTLGGIAAISGFAGGVVGNVADVLNVRMQNDSTLPVQERRNYRNVVHGLIRITSQEGFNSWFRGWLPNSGRAAVTTVAQLATYDAAKSWMIRHLAVEDTLGTQLSASFVAGLTAATVTSPLDVVKTKLMSANGQQGTLQLLRDVTAQEVARWMFKGWVPSFMRQGPHTMGILLFLELHRKTFRRLRDPDWAGRMDIIPGQSMSR